MDKLPDLLLKLLENSFLATLFSGVVLIIISGASKLPLVSTLSPSVKIILLTVGIALIIGKDSGFFKRINGAITLAS
ncbi:MAG: hypothetical protein DCF25_08475, partial [Leptolyngbya foveolarum]